ncbi:MAG: stage III sporulation protein AB [Lachnospiraceae bacterium]|nr:stage III sporulation protein AB [Lachnospiraceae bacterium]MDY4971466.1 stage III sporulation protein AB [Lachnospiraceae bacterium]
MIRFAGICTIAAAILALGFWYSLNTRKRIRNLRLMQTVLHMLKGEIGFTGRILEEAFADISGRVQEPFRGFFAEVSGRLQNQKGDGLAQIWRESEDAFHGSGLKEEDLELFRRLGNELGFLDVDMQLRTLELLEVQVRENAERLEKNCEASCRMYQSLGILGALTVIVVMI